MIRVDPVTARYADALFGLAKRKGALEEVRADVERLDGLLSDPEVAALFFNPRIGAERKRASLATALGQVHELTRNLVGLLLDKRREEVLRRLHAAFRQRLLEERGAVEGVVESAHPLDEAAVAELARALGKRLGKEVQLAHRVRPELVAGVRVVVDNRMVDRSVQGRLEGLRRRLLAAPIPTR